MCFCHSPRCSRKRRDWTLRVSPRPPHETSLGGWLRYLRRVLWRKCWATKMGRLFLSKISSRNHKKSIFPFDPCQIALSGHRETSSTGWESEPRPECKLPCVCQLPSWGNASHNLFLHNLATLLSLQNTFGVIRMQISSCLVFCTLGSKVSYAGWTGMESIPCFQKRATSSQMIRKSDAVWQKSLPVSYSISAYLLPCASDIDMWSPSKAFEIAYREIQGQ